MGAKTTNPVKRLGLWLARAKGTIYQAATDGFVVFYDPSDGTPAGLTDSATPPTITRVQAGTSAVGYFGLTFPVKKNDYWKVTDTDAGCVVWWIPLEP